MHYIITLVAVGEKFFCISVCVSALEKTMISMSSVVILCICRLSGSGGVGG